MVCVGTHPINYGLEQNRLTPFSHQQWGVLPETTPTDHCHLEFPICWTTLQNLDLPVAIIM